MVLKLRVTIGGDRHHVEIAHVNDSLRPTEIDTDKFVGRVLVRVADFRGITADGQPPIPSSAYFTGRSRKFAISVEGRFKRRDDVAPYTADEIHFGTDFDHLVDFPRSAFNAGMKVAKWVDPATFYEEKPPSGRPYIMSPFAGCMNIIAAWPVPERAKDAVCVLRHTEVEDDGAAKHYEEDPVPGTEDLVPIEKIDKYGKKASRHLIKYWRFLGYRDDPKLQTYLKEHAPHILESPKATDPGAASTARPAFSHQQSSLGVFQRVTDSPDSTAAPSALASGQSTPAIQQKSDKKKFGFSLGSMLSSLPGSHSNSGSSTPALSADDFTTADRLLVPPAHPGVSTRLDSQIGTWRFADDSADMVEDNTFVFVDRSVSAPKRRKYFCENGGQNRQKHTFDPDVVYAASFFTSFCDLNTFDLKMGPVSINLIPFFKDMPIRYSLRSTRRDATTHEEEVFATVAFELVDV